MVRVVKKMCNGNYWVVFLIKKGHCIGQHSKVSHLPTVDDNSSAIHVMDAAITQGDHFVHLQGWHSISILWVTICDPANAYHLNPGDLRVECLNVSQIARVSLLICGSSMVHLKLGSKDLFGWINLNKNSSPLFCTYNHWTHPRRVEMSTSGLAVVVELPALVDVEPVQAEAEVKHCPPQLGQARAGIFLVQEIETRQGWTKEELNF